MCARRSSADPLTTGLVDAAAALGDGREARLRQADDPKRQRLGIVHTPAPLARWAMQRVDACLRERVGVPGGLADPRVALLDVSLGTGVWLAAALELAAGRQGAPSAVLGLELEEGALGAARDLLRPVAAQAGWPLSLRCANTLAETNPWPAGAGVRVVVGNPPWSTRSGSRAVQPTEGWLADFRRGPDGEPLSERRVGVLSDDYVRFWRWAAEQARGGQAAVVCMATNASFLDGPVHRGMRARLTEWFDGIDVLDLGGNAMLSRGADRDENVFGVRPGAAVTLLWRTRQPPRGVAQVHYRRVRGRARDKLGMLHEAVARPLSLSSRGVPWSPASGGGESCWPPGTLALPEAMPFHREGVQTNRDAFAIAPTREALLGRMRRFAEGGPGPAPKPHFDPERARRRVASALERDPEGHEWIVPLWYRPFDRRFAVVLAPVSHRPRPALLRAAGSGVPCLLTARKDRGDRPWALFGASAGVADACFLSTRSSCRTRVFPAFDEQGAANLDAGCVRGWLEHLGLPEPVSSVQLLEFSLAQLAAAGYRQRFDGLLRRDYPRLLPPADADGWHALRAVGRRLQQAAYGRIREADPAPEIAPPGCGVGHFEAGALWSSLDSIGRARLILWNEALADADELFARGACA